MAKKNETVAAIEEAVAAPAKKIQIKSVIRSTIVCDNGIEILYGEVIECDRAFAKELLEKGYCVELKTKAV